MSIAYSAAAIHVQSKRRTNNMNKYSKKAALELHSLVIKILNSEISENKFCKLHSRLDVLNISLPSSAYRAVQSFVDSTLESFVFTNETELNEIQKQRREAKLEWQHIVDTVLRPLVVD